MRAPKRKGTPDLAQMRQALEKDGVTIRCTRPGWQASREADLFVLDRPKMRDVIVAAYNILIMSKK